MIQPVVEKLIFYDRESHAGGFCKDVLEGLSLPQKQIASKYLYDERGSRLFNAICKTPEYYLARTEMTIIENNLEEICACLGHGCILIEPGSGSSQKVRLLLDRLEPHTYMPLDISSNYLKSVVHGLAQEYPRINVTAACVDYAVPLDLPYPAVDRRRIVFFPGSSIGNFEPHEVKTFLKRMADLMDGNGGLLIGVDLRKDPAILNAAYNDKQGITAEFNLNLLRHVNRELSAGFDIGGFNHHAFYNEEKCRIEMHLVSNRAQSVKIAGKDFRFCLNETIHTENSYKYLVEEFQALAGQTGFELVAVWLDDRKWFSIQYYHLH